MKWYDVLRSLPKTILFNFKSFPISVAVRLPIWIHYNTSYSVKGRIILKTKPKFALIRFGAHTVPAKSYKEQSLLEVEKGGVLVFQGTGHIGRGSRIWVGAEGHLTLGDNFAISASSSIICYKQITFGRDIQFSWDCLVMDSDAHSIYDVNGEKTNEDKPIKFGNKIWIACRATVLKGSNIGDNSVVGANSFIIGKTFEANSIIAGSPARTINTIKTWEI